MTEINRDKVQNHLKTADVGLISKLSGVRVSTLNEFAESGDIRADDLAKAVMHITGAARVGCSRATVTDDGKIKIVGNPNTTPAVMVPIVHDLPHQRSRTDD